MTHIVQILHPESIHVVSEDYNRPEWENWIKRMFSNPRMANSAIDSWHKARSLVIRQSIIDARFTTLPGLSQVSGQPTLRVKVEGKLAYTFDSLADALLFKLTFAGT